MPHSRIVNERDRFENLKVMRGQIMEYILEKCEIKKKVFFFFFNFALKKQDFGLVPREKLS